MNVKKNLLPIALLAINPSHIAM